MHKLTITKYKPSQTKVTMYEDSTDIDIQTYVTKMTQSNRRKGKKNIPIMPKLHAEGILNITKYAITNKTYLLLPVATYLALHLSKNNPEIVRLSLDDIIGDIGISNKTLIGVLRTLEDLKYIKKLGNSVYYISPSLAFYGSAMDWSLALEIEERGGTLTEFKEEQARLGGILQAIEDKVHTIN